jgi:hypothetical protein
MRKPFAQVALVDAGCVGKLCHRHRAPLVNGLIQAERIADPDQRYARRTAEIRQHLPDELMQLCVIDHFRFLPL